VLPDALCTPARSGISQSALLTAWLSCAGPDSGRTRPTLVSRTADLQHRPTVRNLSQTPEQEAAISW
jgi:hypothetical protein